ncbi:MAG: MoxR family ATPase [Patescibacteria group bacterium]
MSERRPTAKREKPGREPFIVEKDESVSYLGVEVPKGEGGPLVPGRQESENYFYTEEDYLLRREMATSIALNKPILFEGGTGIGKTSAVAAMCAELNLNFCKVSFARDMAIEDVIGGKTIVKEGDAEVVKWYDGNLMVAIRHGGIALLDEYNFQGSKVGSRVNPVIDAILNGRKEISLPENDNERVMVHPNFRLVAAQNPPGTEEGQEFTGREQMSAETFGRWTFNKLPLEMSRDMRDKRLAGMMGESVDIKLPPEAFRKLGEGVPFHELKDIPGMTHWRRAALDVLDQLKAKSTGADRDMAKTQRQRLYFNPRLEQGLLNYVSRFYRGDVNQVWGEAFEHLIVGMYKDEADRQAVRELLTLNAYEPQTDTKRRPLGDAERAEQEGAEETWAKVAEFEDKLATKISALEQELGVSSGESKEISLADAEKILGKESVLGAKDVEQVFGVKLDRIPAIPFSQQELQRAKELGQQLILQVDSMTHKGGLMSREKSAPLTLENLKQKFTKSHDDGKVFYEQDWYKNEDFFKKEKPRTGWRLTSKDLVPDSTSKSYLEQTDVLVEHLEKQIFKGVEVPKQYKDAIAEFKRKRAEIEPLAKSGTDAEWKKGSQMLADLAITKLARELPVEAMYRLILNDQTRKDKPLPLTYTWTACRASGGSLVDVGCFGDAGAAVDGGSPDVRYDRLGVSFSRS